MPKRKRISFSVKKRHSTSAPNPASQPAKRPRGRPPKSTLKAQPRTRSPSEPEDDGENGEDDKQDVEEQEFEEGDEPENHAQDTSNVDIDDDDDDDDNDDDDEEEEEKEEENNSSDDSSTFKAPRSGTTVPAAAVAYVSKSTIEKKWTRLPLSSQAAVSSLIDACAVPIVAAHLDGRRAERDDGRGAEAQEAVARAVRALKRRIPRMPFPSTTGTNDGDGGGSTGDDNNNNSNSLMFAPDPLRRRNRALRTEAAAYSRDAVPGLEAELAKVRAAVEERANEADAYEAEYERDRDAVKERRAEGSRFADLLRIPGEEGEDGDGEALEPEDSARRIRLAPWTQSGGKRRGRGSVPDTSEDSADLPEEAKRLVEKLRERVAGLQVRGDTVNAARDSVPVQLDTDLQRASVVMDRLTLLQGNPRRKMEAKQLSVG